MSLRASFVYKNPDSTRDLNARLRRVINRGVVWGGAIAPGGGMTVQVAPLVAVGFDGMTVEESVPVFLTVVAAVKQYLVIQARYNEGGVPALPTLVWRVLTAAAYAIDPEKDYMIVVGTVTTAGPVVGVADLDLTERDEVNPLGRDWYRGVVANAAALPVAPPTANRVGDFYFVIADHTFYFWNSTIWEPLNTGSYNSETELQNHQVISQQRDRQVNGSGVIAGTSHPVGWFPGSAAGPEITLLASGTANTLAFDTFSALVNGHYVEAHAQELALAAPPAAPGTRYDLVFLEVWRELVVPPVVPESHLYEGNTTLAGPPPPTFTIDQVDTKMETLQWTNGMAVAGNNIDLDEVNARNHGWVVVRHRFSYQSGVATSALYRSSLVAPACFNVDGVAFTASTTDTRIWSAAAVASSVDGVSWAIPLFVVKRAFGDVLITEYTSSIRKVFPVYPVADLDNAAKNLLVSELYQEPFPWYSSGREVLPSGFITGMDHEIKTNLGVNNIKVFPDTGAKIRFRNYEDLIGLSGGFGADLPIGVAPAIINNWDRTLVYLKMSVTLYNDQAVTGTGYRFTSFRHHPLLPSYATANPDNQGWKRGYVTYELIAQVFNNDATILDEDAAMAAAGWSRGDVTPYGIPAHMYEDGGLWSKAVAIDADDRIHPYLAEWAIPVCLVHRRNSIAWNYTTNPNGSAGRPDGLTNPALIYGRDYDMLDLRHDVGVDESELRSRLDMDIDKAMKGQLRTRMANKYLGAGGAGVCAGTRILQSDMICDGAVVTGAYKLTPADGFKRIWSDAKEYHVVSVSFALSVDSSSAIYDYNITGAIGVAGTFATLVIKAPPGAHLLRHIPAVTYSDGDTAAASYLDFYGSPLWSTRASDHAAVPISTAIARYSDSHIGVSYTNEVIPFCPYVSPAASAHMVATTAYQPFAVTATDLLGRATEMTGILDLEGAPFNDPAHVFYAVLSWWVHYDRNYVVTADNYHLNYGLAEIPDVVHQAILGPTTGAPQNLNVGPLCCSVRVAVVPPTAVVTISTAQLHATFGTGVVGDYLMVGTDLSSFLGNATLPAGAVVTMNAARTTLTITFGAPYTGTFFEALVYFEHTDIPGWVEVGRGGKSVQALFAWDSKTYTGATIDPGPHTINLVDDIWTQVEYAGRQFQSMPLIWARTNPGTTYTLVPKYCDYPNSNMLSIANMGAVYDEFLFIFPVHRPLTNVAADYLLLHYTYTPYQGLSADGGSAPVAVTAVPKLKSMLHGLVVEDSDFYATQSGPCSYFSGVHAWSGFPVNRVPKYREISSFLWESQYLPEVLPEYNDTALVSYPAATVRNTLEQSGAYLNHAVMNAAAILRLPYPTNVGMISYKNNHLGCAEFDLDPARAGAGAGYLTFAPGYICGGGTTYLNKAVATQFSNGLSSLAVNEVLSYAKTHSALEWIPIDGDTSLNHADNYIASGGVDLMRCLPIIPNNSFNIAKTVTFDTVDLTGFDPVTLAGQIGRFGTLVYASIDNSAALCGFLLSNVAADAYGIYSYLGLGVGVERIIFSTHPAEALRCAALTYDSALKIVMVIKQIAATNLLYSTMVFGHRDVAPRTIDWPGASTASYLYSKVADTVQIPVTSGSSSQQTHTYAAFSTYGSTSGGATSVGRLTLKGDTLAYPTGWSVPMAALADSLFQATLDQRGAGRGLYCGSASKRYAISTFVPGSGVDLPVVLEGINELSIQTQVAPARYGYIPPVSLFSDNNKAYFVGDHGGPLAYVFRGAIINPTADQYHGRAVLQLCGGPTGGPSVNESSALFPRFNPNDLDGTAIDAFWPTGRPLLKSRK
jgi:hypothetical protein